MRGVWHGEEFGRGDWPYGALYKRAVPYGETHDKETVERVHGELWSLSLALYHQDALKQYRLLAEVIRLYENHYGLEPRTGFQHRAVRSADDGDVQINGQRRRG